MLGLKLNHVSKRGPRKQTTITNREYNIRKDMRHGKPLSTYMTLQTGLIIYDMKMYDTKIRHPCVKQEYAWNGKHPPEYVT